MCSAVGRPAGTRLLESPALCARGVVTPFFDENNGYHGIKALAASPSMKLGPWQHQVARRR
jgi:hypothetical protein